MYSMVMTIITKKLKSQEADIIQLIILVYSDHFLRVTSFTIMKTVVEPTVY